MTKTAWKAGTMLYPLPPVMVTCGTLETPNVFTAAWTGIVNSEPAMTYISIRPSRYSYELIKQSGEFVINLTTVQMLRAADFCGVKSGKEIDKFAETGLTLLPCNKVKTPMLEQSPLSLECRVTEIKPLGSHDMFLAEIVAVNVNDELLDGQGRFELEKSGLVAFCHGEYYALGGKLGTFGFSVAKKKSRKERITEIKHERQAVKKVRQPEIEEETTEEQEEKPFQKSFRRSEKRPFDRDNRRSFDRDDRKPFDRDHKKPFDRDDRKPFDRDHKKPFDRDDRKPFDKDKKRPFDRDDRKPFDRDHKKPFDRDDRKPFDKDKKRPFDRDDRKPFDRDHKKPFDRDDRKPFDKDKKRPFDRDDRKPFDKDKKRPFDRDDRKPFDKDKKRPFAKEGRKPFSKEGRPFKEKSGKPFKRNDKPNR